MVKAELYGHSCSSLLNTVPTPSSAPQAVCKGAVETRYLSSSAVTLLSYPSEGCLSPYCPSVPWQACTTARGITARQDSGHHLLHAPAPWLLQMQLLVQPLSQEQERSRASGLLGESPGRVKVAARSSQCRCTRPFLQQTLHKAEKCPFLSTHK